MKVKAYETFRVDAGWRTFSFLKITTDNDIVGWSEYNESFGSPGLSGAIDALMPSVIGQDPRRIEYINAKLLTQSIQSRGGIARQAAGAIENALLDIKGKHFGVPVVELLGGSVRTRLPVYWSHCGSYRVRNWEHCGTPRVRTFDDLVGLGKEVRERGFSCLKANIATPDANGDLQPYRPGFALQPGFPERNANGLIIDSAVQTIRKLREGAGEDVEILMDVNFNFHTEGYRQLIYALRDEGINWFEADIHDPQALRLLRNEARFSIASGETLLERRDFKPYFEAYSMDVAIVDVVWNGFAESLKIAAMAEAFDVNVAPHNFYGHLASVMSAHFSAAVPNLRIMETDVDSVTWRDEFVVTPPTIENGEFLLPTGPGWGVEVNEQAIRARQVAK